MSKTTLVHCPDLKSTVVSAAYQENSDIYIVENKNDKNDIFLKSTIYRKGIEAFIKDKTFKKRRIGVVLLAASYK